MERFALYRFSLSCSRPDSARSFHALTVTILSLPLISGAEKAKIYRDILDYKTKDNEIPQTTTANSNPGNRSISEPGGPATSFNIIMTGFNSISNGNSSGNGSNMSPSSLGAFEFASARARLRQAETMSSGSISRDNHWRPLSTTNALINLFASSSSSSSSSPSCSPSFNSSPIERRKTTTTAIIDAALSIVGPIGTTDVEFDDDVDYEAGSLSRNNAIAPSSLLSSSL